MEHLVNEWNPSHILIKDELKAFTQTQLMNKSENKIMQLMTKINETDLTENSKKIWLFLGIYSNQITKKFWSLKNTDYLNKRKVQHIWEGKK